MKWLKLSSFEPIPDIQFSLKKPLFAASVVLHYSPQHSRASLEARVPLKGRIAYSIDVTAAAPAAGSRGGHGFAFSRISERDDVKNVERVTHPSDFAFEVPANAQVLAHVQALPAFLASRDARTRTYGGWIAVGRKLQALRIDHMGGPTYAGRLIHVPEPLSETAWKALPWESKRAFEFDWSDERQTLAAARMQLPLIGKLEIRA